MNNIFIWLSQGCKSSVRQCIFMILYSNSDGCVILLRYNIFAIISIHTTIDSTSLGESWPLLGNAFTFYYFRSTCRHPHLLAIYVLSTTPSVSTPLPRIQTTYLLKTVYRLVLAYLALALYLSYTA